MSFIPVPYGALVTIVYELANKFVTNNIWYKGSVDWTSGDLEALAENVWDELATTFPDENSDVCFVNRVEARAMHTQFGPNVLWEPSTPLEGLVVSAPMPNQVCVVTTLITGLVGRSYRGRVYNPGITEADVTANTVSTDYRTARDVQWTALRGVSSPNDAELSVCSRYQGGEPREYGILTAVNNVNTNSRVDTQRRRLPD